MALPTDPDNPLAMFAPEQPDAPPQADPSEVPAAIAPPAQAPTIRESLVTLPMTKGEVAEWRARIKLSEQRTEQRESEWDKLWKQYLPDNKYGIEAEDAKVNAHFRNTHTKMGQLFVRSPEVRMTPKGRGLDVQQQPPTMDPMTGALVPQPAIRAEDGIRIRQAVVNMYMGPDYIDAMSLMDDCLLQMQAYSGFAAVRVFYKSVSRLVQRPVMMPDPNFIPPPIPEGSLGLNMPGPAQVPSGQTETIQVPIHECWCAETIHPKKLLFDEKLASTRIERDSRWIGRTFFIPKRLAMRQYGLTLLEVEQAVSQDDRRFMDDADRAMEMVEKDLLRGQEIWLKAEYFTDNDNPDAMVQLVLFDCVPEAPVVYRMSVDQTFDDMGALTEDSLEGFPILVGSLRTTLDSPFPKSDSAFVDTDVTQLDVHRKQMVALRDAAIGKIMYDTGQIDEEDKNKLQSANVGAMIGLKPGSLAAGADKIFTTTAQVRATSDDWRTADMFEKDMEKTLGISSAQMGGQNDKVISATEVQTQNQGSVGRADKEKARVIAFYLKIVRAVDTLLFRYATGDRYIMVAGQMGAKKLEIWNKKIGAGKYSYDIKPDSQLVLDVARDRQQKVAAYTTMAPDPLVNRVPMLRDISGTFGLDPAEVVLDPATVNAQQMAAQATGMPMGQPPHQAGPNKHVVEKSGDTPNGAGKAQSGDNRQERNPRPQGGA